jgi:serine/threonine protein kinase
LSHPTSDAALPDGVTPLEPQDPRELGGHRIVGRIGQGGMGLVYLAQMRSGRRLAIKVVRDDYARDAEFRSRFRREAVSAQKVRGHYTAALIDVDLDGPSPWLATEYVPGPTLSRAVALDGPLAEDRVRSLVANIAEALQAVHRAGLVHRDLKAGNVLLGPDGPCLIDLGIAQSSDATSLTATGMLLGTPMVMAPEQATGAPIGPAADVWALGALAFFAATGEHAFGKARPDVMYYRVVHEEPRLERCPDYLRPFVTWCLAKDPADRPTIREILDAQPELVGRPVTEAGPEPEPAPEPQDEPRPLLPVPAFVTDLAPHLPDDEEPTRLSGQVRQDETPGHSHLDTGSGAVVGTGSGAASDTGSSTASGTGGWADASSLLPDAAQRTADREGTRWSSTSTPAPTGPRRPAPEPPRRSRTGWYVLAAVVLVGGGTAAAFTWLSGDEDRTPDGGSSPVAEATGAAQIDACLVGRWEQTSMTDRWTLADETVDVAGWDGRVLEFRADGTQVARYDDADPVRAEMASGTLVDTWHGTATFTVTTSDGALGFESADYSGTTVERQVGDAPAETYVPPSVPGADLEYTCDDTTHTESGGAYSATFTRLAE